MIGLRAGHTLRKFWLTRNCPRFKAYCGANPEYAREALPLCGGDWQIEKAAEHFSPPKNALRPPGEN
jgi:hypothetical protein